MHGTTMRPSLVAKSTMNKLSKPRRRCILQLASGVWLGALLLSCNLIITSNRRLFEESRNGDEKFLQAKGENIDHAGSVGFGRQKIESEEVNRAIQMSRYAYHHIDRKISPTNQRVGQKISPANHGEGARGTLFSKSFQHSGAKLNEKKSLQPRNISTASEEPPSPFPAPIKVPLPIFVASLYKSGTTTTHSYFECGGQRSVHWTDTDGHRTGKCIRENILVGREPFQGCGDYDVWSDNSWMCWDPSVSDLDAIYQAYPNATILLTVRDSYAWINSVMHWGKLLRRLGECHNLWPGQPRNRQITPEDIRKFYLWQIQHVRDFAATHPSMTFLEVSLESNETASLLEERIGIPASCWGHHNENNKNKMAAAT
jgi:hypothetical protein